MAVTNELTETAPWLGSIPQDILNNHCVDEFRIPGVATLKLIEQMGEKLNCYIMTYSLDTFRIGLSPGKHLCANISRAALSAEQLAMFLTFENSVRCEGISLAAYERPVRLIMPAAFSCASATC